MNHPTPEEWMECLYGEGDPRAGAARIGDLRSVGPGCEARQQCGVFTAERKGEGTETGNFCRVVLIPIVVLRDQVGTLVDLDRRIG